MHEFIKYIGGFAPYDMGHGGGTSTYGVVEGCQVRWER